MIPVNDIQAAIIAHLQVQTALTDAMNAVKSGASVEIRENQWAGTSFIYPAIRLDMQTQTEEGDPPCYARQPFSVYAMTEDDSSANCGNILSLVDSALIRANIRGTGFKIGLIVSSGSVPPIRSGNRIWQAVGQYSANVYQTGGLA